MSSEWLGVQYRFYCLLNTKPYKTEAEHTANSIIKADGDLYDIQLGSRSKYATAVVNAREIRKENAATLAGI